MKSKTVISYLLLAICSFLPVLTLILYCCGYSVSLTCYPLFSVISALILIASASMISKHKITCKALAILPVISLINMTVYVFKSRSAVVLVFMMVCFVYSAIIAEESCSSTKTKTASVITSSFLFVPILIVSIAIVAFSGFGVNTVIEKIYSPEETYYAEIVDSDQGALGGNTVVYVHKNHQLNLLILTINKTTQRIYIGDWKEYETMQIYWKNENCLVINKTEYEI